MLVKLQINNFKCFQNHEVNFNELSIIVGKNNAGKSTLIEALRIVSLAASKFKTSLYNSPPNWLELPLSSKGIKPSTRFLDLNKSNIFHNYSDGPAKITAYYLNKVKITVYIGTGTELFCILTDTDGNAISTKGQASKIDFTNINILPQISLLEKEEKILVRDYVKQNVSSDLSSRHFRNQLSIFNEYFEKFKSLSEETWNGIRITSLDGKNGIPGSEDRISLFIQDNHFVSEIGWLGSGIQMWLQIMWFLSRVDENEIIILDEPDIYMHPELQRKLINILKNKYKQVIIATHSIEIISEVEPKEILIIDKNKTKSIFANKIPVVQGILNSIGSIHNLQLTKLWSSKKLLIVEGEDVSILKKIQSKIFPNSNEPFDTIPNFDIGGWGGWYNARGSSLLLKETIDKNVNIYCIFDSDYFTKSEIEKRICDANKINVNIHIWKKKEIENYLIIPSTIVRIIQKESKKNVKISSQEIEEKIFEFSNLLKDDVIDKIADCYQKENRGLAISTARNKAKEQIDSIIDRVSGKEIISKLSHWTQTEFGTSLSPNKIAIEMNLAEIDSEIKKVITSIETLKSF